MTTGTLERIQELEERAKKAEDRLTVVESTIQAIISAFQQNIQKVTGIEQALTTMGKTMAAVTAELVDKKSLDNDAVMGRIRSNEDEEQKNQIKNLLASKAIKADEVIEATSFIVVRHSVLDTADGSTNVISDYSLVSIASPQVSEDLRKQLVGKKVGDTVEGMTEGAKKELITVKEVYSIVEKIVQGEEPAKDSEGPDQAESKE